VSAVKSDYTTEFKDMVKKFHKAGIEIIMEMHFHGETTDFILDCMHYWVLEYHIDGFYLYADEASLDAASKDPLLSKTKIIMVRFNGEKKLYKNIANYNSDFMNVARKFLKGDENQLRDFVRVSRNNPPQNANINYITSHDGFTLMDLVSFERRHNEYNGSINLDGENFNNSWNCGAEGETKKRHILQLRKRQMKNAFMLLFLSQGTPLLLAGDECCNSQDGNNNPYCIDSELSWVNWKNRGMAKEMTDFVKELIAFRKKYKILHMPEQLHAYDVLECGFPDVSTHGDSAWYDAMESFNRHIGIMYYNRYSCEDTDKNVFIYIAYNMHWEKHMLALPKIDDSCKWEAVISSGTKESAVIQPDNRSVEVEPRCIVVLTCSIKEKADRKRVNKGIEKNEYQ
jgi:glycogen operon protein